MPKNDDSHLFSSSPDTQEAVEQPETPGSAGAILKRERLSRDIELEKVAESTRINIRILRALEDNDHANLPAKAFVRGFISIYADYLGLDPEKILALPEQQDTVRTHTGENLNPHDIVRFQQVPNKISLSPRYLIALIVAIVLLGSAIYFGYSHYFYPATSSSRSTNQAQPATPQDIHEKEKGV